MTKQPGWLKRDFIIDLYIPEESVARAGTMKSYRSLSIRQLKPATNLSRCAIKVAVGSANMDQRRSQRASDAQDLQWRERSNKYGKYDIRA